MEHLPLRPQQNNGTNKAKKKTAESVRNKDVFTTGDVALICGISQQSVIRCFDAAHDAPEKLKGFRIPGSTHRRIVRTELETFMKKCGIPLEWLSGENGAPAESETSPASSPEEGPKVVPDFAEEIS